MRWRGVRVRSRDGQRCSQNPHSMQRSAIGEMVVVGFRSLRWTRGSSLRMTPGFRTPSGSKRALTRRMMS
jgi:hypothetical protein